MTEEPRYGRRCHLKLCKDDAEYECEMVDIVVIIFVKFV